MLPARISAYLNAGDTVVVETSTEDFGEATFVRVRPVPKPGVPREERRYLNSAWSQWEYWDFEFRRLVLQDGWRDDEWNFDRYIIEDGRRLAIDQATFEAALNDWVPDVARFKHISESACPE
jgi:hypothetical protein